MHSHSPAGPPAESKVMNLIQSAIGAVRGALLEPEEDARLANALASRLASAPIPTIHAASLSTARKIYADSCGFQVCGTMAPALQPATPEQRAALSESTDPEDAYARMTGLVATGPEQLRLELDRSGLVAITVPAGSDQCAAYRSLMMAGGNAAPAIESACRTFVTLLFAKPGDATLVNRRLEIDPVLDAIKPAGDQSNVVRLPHAGVLERWIRIGPPPMLPPELLGQLRASASVQDADVITWLGKHYRVSRKGEKGCSRDDVYSALLAANNWTASDYHVNSLSRCAAALPGFASTRRSSGIIWLLTRTDLPLSALDGVPSTTLDTAMLAAFQSWFASREMSPARRAERADLAALRKAKLEEAALIAARFGSADVRDDLCRPERVEGHFGEVNFIQVHEKGEAMRQRACSANAVEFVALPLQSSTPEWWTLSPAGTPHLVRYRRLVAVRVRGEK